MVPRVPNALFDFLIAKYKLKNDRELGDLLDLDKPVVSRIRNKKRGISAEIILRTHEITGMPISEVKAIAEGKK